jgi:squalene-associated FAD-dependent desaturase
LKAVHPRRIAVVGAGWAGLAAAVQATADGHQVTLYDMAHQPGGRARSMADGARLLDNGQHILIGAYQQTLALMRQVGADPDRLLHRRPLALVDACGKGLRLPRGPALPAFAIGVLRWHDLPWPDRLHCLLMAARWRLQGFRCDPGMTVAELAKGCPDTIYNALLEPLCVAALNTPAHEASAQVLLTVLRDALFGARGAADLLLPCAPLDELLPTPALAWLKARGAAWRAGHRVQSLAPTDNGWQVDGHDHDHVVLACSAKEAARLLLDVAPAWAAQAAAFRYEPIVTVWLQAASPRWPLPMVAFPAGRHATHTPPAQFGFDLGQLGQDAGLYAMVVSGASTWLAQGQDAVAQAVLAQWAEAFGPGYPAQVVAVRAERRATFACTPGLARPPMQATSGITVAGDYVAGPYPATLEGAVRSGLAAVLGL